MNKLRKRLILAVCLITTAVFLVVLGTLAGLLSLYNRNQAENMAGLIVANNGSVPSKQEFDNAYNGSEFNGIEISGSFNMDDETAFRTRYFTIHTDKNGNISNESLDHIAAVDEKMASSMMKTVLANRKKSGYLKHFFYKVADEDTGYMIVFLDCHSEFDSLQLVVETVGGIMLFLVAVVTALFGLFSKKIILPFEKNSKKQKQFITDASHELKTPLAIISANADVMKYKYGENDWLNNITDQTKQMSQLIGELLTLTKADEVGTDFVRENVDLAPVLHETWDAFHEAALEKQVEVKTEIPENLQLTGNKEMLQKLFSVLAENAAKYVTERGQMEIKAQMSAKKVTVQIYNSADLPEHMDCTHLFERFYRPDSSRSSKTGGHGIGLAIAGRIVEDHKGSIRAEQIRDGLMFTVVLPRK